MQPYKRRHRPAGAGVEYMGNDLLQVLHEQQNIIEQQSRLIVDLTATLENWESVAGYDGAELNLQKQKGRIYGNESYGIYQHGSKQQGN